MKKDKVLFSIKNLWEYCSIIALLLECSSIYVNQNKWNIISSNSILLIGFLPLTIKGLLYILGNKEKQQIFGRAILGYIFFMLVYLITLGRAEAINFLMKFGILYLSIYIYILYLVLSSGFSRYAKRYVSVISVIAVISFVFWIFGSILGVLRPNGVLPYTWGSMQRSANSYFDIYFETQIEQTLFKVWRNTAFFTEAPKYGLTLTIGFLLNHILVKNKKIAVILFATIVSTFSFTAVIAVVMLYSVEYSLGVFRDVLSKRAKVRTIIWPILAIIVIIAVSFFMGEKIDSSSGVGRIGDFVICFGVGMMHPIFGWGFLDNEYLNVVLHSARLASGVGNTMGLSNSISQIFVDGGLFFILFYIRPIISLINWGKKYNPRLFSAGIVLLYLIITTYFAYAGIMFFVLSLGYCFVLLRNKKKYLEIFYN